MAHVRLSGRDNGIDTGCHPGSRASTPESELSLSQRGVILFFAGMLVERVKLDSLPRVHIYLFNFALELFFDCAPAHLQARSQGAVARREFGS